MTNKEKEELLLVVAELSEKFTSKSSSSITYGTAQKLMNAAIYCINENITSKNSLRRSEESIKTQYEVGYQMVLKKVEKAKGLYEKVILDFQSYGNISCYDTVIKGMPVFFINYDAKFNPQDHVLTLDYPTIKPLGDLCGIDIIYTYLQYIELEQNFLKEFENIYIVELLMRYNANYEELFINISRVVLRNAIACVIVGRNINSSRMNAKNYKVIRQFIMIHSKEELEEKLRNIIYFIMKRGFGGNQALLSYLSEDIKDLVFEMKRAVEKEFLEVLFS